MAYSPFDDVFRRFAGTLASVDEFIAIVATGSFGESGWNTLSTGDGGHSRGLFQINDLYHPGGNWRLDPAQASAYMVPVYANVYRQVKAANPGLQGAELASLVSALAERPEGYDNPASSARQNYRNAYAHVVAFSGGQVPASGNTSGGSAQQPGGGTGAPETLDFGHTLSYVAGNAGLFVFGIALLGLGIYLLARPAINVSLPKVGS